MWIGCRVWQMLRQIFHECDYSQPPVLKAPPVLFLVGRSNTVLGKK